MAAGALVVALVIVASAIASTTRSKKASDDLSGTLTLNVFTFSAPVMKPVFAAFQKLHPKVKISAAYVPNTPNTYVPLLQTEKLAGKQPAINETYDVLTPTLEVKHLVADLTPNLQKGVPYSQNYWLPTFMASYVPPAGAPVGTGHVFALPNEADATVIMYNKDEFKKAGVAFPHNGWTWNEMLADASKLKVGTGASQTQYGICERPDWQAEYNPVLKAFGVTSFTESKATLATPAAIKAWKLMIGPLQNGLAVPEAQQQAKNGSSGCEPFFESGEAAMSIEVRGNLPGLIQDIGSKFAFDVAPMPSIPVGGKKVVPTGGGSLGWTLAPSAVSNDLANAFLKYLFSAQGQVAAEKTCGVVPAVASLNGPNALWRKLTSCRVANNEAYVIAANTATIAPQTPGTVFTLSNTAVPNAVIASTTGGKSVEEAFASLQKQIDDAYKQNK